MALSLYNIKKWYRMLTGKSVLHVQQDLGKMFVPGKLEGYFNNMTQKVTMEPALLESDGLPQLQTEQGDMVYFPVAIFQYGLGAWDLFLQAGEERYQKKFLQCADWAVEKQEETGAWNNFFYIYPDNPYGAMCQGEGASLLLRAHKLTGEQRYLAAAKKALDFMLLPLEQGGTAKYDGEELVLLEYTHLPAVLNGWVFALAGLYDLVVTGYGADYEALLRQTVKTLVKYMPRFDNGYWSLYDLDKKLTSPFYHDLHIAQMQALEQMSGETIFGQYASVWTTYRNKKWNSMRAFVKKAAQKILEKN